MSSKRPPSSSGANGRRSCVDRGGSRALLAAGIHNQWNMAWQDSPLTVSNQVVGNERVLLAIRTIRKAMTVELIR
jgi:hypothetical protein